MSEKQQNHTEIAVHHKIPDKQNLEDKIAKQLASGYLTKKEAKNITLNNEEDLLKYSSWLDLNQEKFILLNELLVNKIISEKEVKYYAKEDAQFIINELKYFKINSEFKNFMNDLVKEQLVPIDYTYKVIDDLIYGTDNSTILNFEEITNKIYKQLEAYKDIKTELLAHRISADQFIELFNYVDPEKIEKWTKIYIELNKYEKIGLLTDFDIKQTKEKYPDNFLVEIKKIIKKHEENLKIEEEIIASIELHKQLRKK